MLTGFPIAGHLTYLLPQKWARIWEGNLETQTHSLMLNSIPSVLGSMHELDDAIDESESDFEFDFWTQVSDVVLCWNKHGHKSVMYVQCLKDFGTGDCTLLRNWHALAVIWWHTDQWTDRKNSNCHSCGLQLLEQDCHFIVRSPSSLPLLSSHSPDNCLSPCTNTSHEAMSSSAWVLTCPSAVAQPICHLPLTSVSLEIDAYTYFPISFCKLQCVSGWDPPLRCAHMLTQMISYTKWPPSPCASSPFKTVFLKIVVSNSEPQTSKLWAIFFSLPLDFFHCDSVAAIMKRYTRSFCRQGHSHTWNDCHTHSRITRHESIST